VVESSARSRVSSKRGSDAEVRIELRGEALKKTKGKNQTIKRKKVVDRGNDQVPHGHVDVRSRDTACGDQTVLGHHGQK